MKAWTSTVAGKKRSIKIKSYFLEQIDKINKHQTKLTKTQRKRTQISHIRNESWDIISDSMGIK